MIEDPDLAEFYDALQTVTTGPLFTVERWRAIWAMNTGAFDSL